ncbi:MAG: ATP-binding cassette domain-containing protein [Thermodesulfobacteriota bacterium]|nr:ATP-binding cassette domain-containing protein [Thermodesulfobacteriota bacterium]
MIEIFHVSKTYPSQIEALSDIYLEVSPGEFIFIAGPSGSGKSTLLRILFGAEKPSSGEVIVNGIRITQSRFKKVHQLRRTMGIVSPDFKLLRDRNVRENVAFALEVTGHAPREIKGRVSEILRQVGLQEREKDLILSLSAGEQQRVAIARALVNAPPLILADEPTGILDDQMTEEVMKIFGELHQKGATILFATQDINLIQRYPHRVIPLVAGRRVDVETGEGVRSEA